MEIYNGEYCVYCHTNKINGKKYIGITKTLPTKRWHGGKGYSTQPKFYNAIQKYGWDGFDHEIIASKLTQEEAKNFEILLIDKLNCVQNGYNVSLGGDTGNGVEYTKEIREKLSRRFSGEGNPRYGATLTEETKRKISQTLTGRKIPEKSRGNNTMAKKVVYDGIIFDCGKDLADYLGVSADTIYSWLSDPKMKPPQNIVEKGIGYYGDALIQEGYKRRPPHTTTICEGKIFKTGKECAKYYNINPSTMTKWLNGTNPMPQEWIEKGLKYV